MKHLDDATILAVRDSGPVAADIQRHLASCATCSAALSTAHMRAEEIARTLTALDGPVESTAAKAGVRARLNRPGTRSAKSLGGRHLGRAAALVLLTAGAAAALPGSPVRNLWSPPPADPAFDVPTPAEAAPAEATPISPTPSVVQSAGISVAIPDGRVHVVVRGAAPGSIVSVVWTDQAVASLSAAAGSRFTYASGRIEVDASRGAVDLELPRGAEQVSLEVDGSLYLTGSPERPEVLGPAIERSGEAIRFSVVER